ncbi:MAG TPA: SpoIIE family protein phosphatase, partial [Spirochaetota bacterium]
MLRAGIYMLGKSPHRWFFPALVGIEVIFLVAATFLMRHTYVLFIGFQLNVFVFTFCMIASILRLIANPRISRKIGVLLIFGIMVSLILPFMMLSISLIADMRIPLSFYMILSLLMPLVLVNNLGSDNIRDSFSIKKRYYLRFFLDIIAAICMVVAFNVIVTREIHGNHGWNNYLLLFPGVLILLWLRKILFDLIRDENPVYRNIFSDAVRKVSEISATPIDFEDKIQRTCVIIRETTGVRYIHFELFELSIVNKIEGMDDIISYSRGSTIEKFIVRYPNILNRDDFFSGTRFEILNITNPQIDLIVPIRSKGYTIGILSVGDKENNQPLADDEVTFFHSLSVIIYQLIENEILYKEYIMKRDYEREIDIASYIQMRLFPKRLPLGKGIHIAHYSRPYLKVTGDYYDFIDIDERKTLVAIGDVAGHGLSAATILAVVGNILHAMVHEGKDMGEIMNELNHFFSVRYRGTELMTLFLIEFDNTDQSMSYINAGHCSPYLYRDNKYDSDFLSIKSPILGASRDFLYKTTRVNMMKNDEIILYTDGIVEIQGDRYGNNVGDRILLDAMEESHTLDIDQKISTFSGQIEKFPRHAIHDDITVIGVKVL